MREWTPESWRTLQPRGCAAALVVEKTANIFKAAKTFLPCCTVPSCWYLLLYLFRSWLRKPHGFHAQLFWGGHLDLFTCRMYHFTKKKTLWAQSRDHDDICRKYVLLISPHESEVILKDSAWHHKWNLFVWLLFRQQQLLEETDWSQASSRNR